MEIGKEELIVLTGSLAALASALATAFFSFMNRMIGKSKFQKTAEDYLREGNKKMDLVYEVNRDYQKNGAREIRELHEAMFTNREITSQILISMKETTKSVERTVLLMEQIMKELK